MGMGGMFSMDAYAPVAPVAPAPPSAPFSAVFGQPPAQFATPQEAINDAFDQMGYQASPLSGIDEAIGAINSTIGPQQAAPFGFTDTAPTSVNANDAVSQGFADAGFGTGTLGAPGQGFGDGFGAGATGIAGISGGGFADSGPAGFSGDPGAAANLGGYGYGISSPADAAAAVGDTGEGDGDGDGGGGDD